ncbi:hypothetical protein AVEN_174008-1, partial [Araneus ventricosus]
MPLNEHPIPDGQHSLSITTTSARSPPFPE